MSVRLREVTAGYGPVRVLDRQSLEVASGEWLGIIGPNGAGKTTLLGVIAGIVAAAGVVEIEGVPRSELGSQRAARLVAFVPQQPIMPAGMTVTDYVLLGRTPYRPLFGAETAADREAVARAMSVLELDELQDRPVTELSGGEQQRAVLARALAQESRVLLLDEPTTGLDIGHRQQALELISAARDDRQLTVIAAMHDLTLAGQFAQRLVMMADGKLLADGTADQVLTAANISRFYGAEVEVVASGDGPAVIPVRERRS